MNLGCGRISDTQVEWGDPSAVPIHVESVSQEDADAEEDTYCCDDLGHSSLPA